MFFICKQLASEQCDDLVQTFHDKRNERKDNVQFFSSLAKPSVYKPLITLLILFMLQQLSGGYVLIFYTINIFRNLGSAFVTSVDENLASLLLGLIRLLMAIVAAFLSQKFNRKTLLYVSTIGMTIFALLVSFKLWNNDSSDHSIFSKHVSNRTQITSDENEAASNIGNYFLLTFILAYILFASLGLLIIPWTYISELFSIKYKAIYGGLTVALAYVFMFIVLRIFPFMLESINISLIFLIFGCASLLCGIFVHFYLPETHRKTFAEIENYFLGNAGD
jgi:MFS family permease